MIYLGKTISPVKLYSIEKYCATLNRETLPKTPDLLTFLCQGQQQGDLKHRCHQEREAPERAGRLDTSSDQGHSSRGAATAGASLRRDQWEDEAGGGREQDGAMQTPGSSPAKSLNIGSLGSSGAKHCRIASQEPKGPMHRQVLPHRK